MRNSQSKVAAEMQWPSLIETNFWNERTECTKTYMHQANENKKLMQKDRIARGCEEKVELFSQFVKIKAHTLCEKKKKSWIKFE